MNEKRASDVICGTEEALGFTILRESVWAREAVGDAIHGEGAQRGVDEFTTIITLQGFNNDIVLGFDKHEEMLECKGRVRFLA